MDDRVEITAVGAVSTPTSNSNVTRIVSEVKNAQNDFSLWEMKGEVATVEPEDVELSRSYNEPVLLKINRKANNVENFDSPEQAEK